MLHQLPATAEAIEQLAAFGDDTLNGRLQQVAKLVLEMVPASALSIWFVDEDLTLTMVGEEDAAELDGRERDHLQMRSSIALHIAAETRLTAIVTVYSRQARAFTGRISWIEHAVGAVPATSILDNDLGFRSRRDAELAPAQVRTKQSVDMAIGALVGRGFDLDEAECWLGESAELMALTRFEVARQVLDLSREPDVPTTEQARLRPPGTGALSPGPGTPGSPGCRSGRHGSRSPG